MQFSCLSSKIHWNLVLGIKLTFYMKEKIIIYDTEEYRTRYRIMSKAAICVPGNI